MPTAIVARSGATFTARVEIPYDSSMLDSEEATRKALDEAGALAATETPSRLDAGASPIQTGDTKPTGEGQAP